MTHATPGEMKSLRSSAERIALIACAQVGRKCNGREIYSYNLGYHLQDIMTKTELGRKEVYVCETGSHATEGVANDKLAGDALTTMNPSSEQPSLGIDI